MTLSRYEHTGAAPATGLASGIGSTDTSFSVLSGTGYPTGAVGKFVICIDAGTSSEEKILCSARSGTTFTVATSGRGYDNTTAASHSAGTVNVTHVCSAAEIDDTSDHIYTTTRDDHSQYLRTDGTRAGTGAQTIGGKLTVSTGGADISGDSKITGTLEATGAVTVDAGGLTVTAGGLTVTAGGLTVSAGGITATGTSTITGALTVTSLTQTADDATWTAPTLTNSWANIGSGQAPAGYRKYNGRVYLRGFLISGNTGTSVFTLPSGYRPAYAMNFSYNFIATSAFAAALVVNTDGTVVASWVGSPSTHTAILDGISFDTLS